MCEEGIIDGEKERGKLQLDTRPGGTDQNLPIQCTTTARDPAGRETPRAAGRGSDGPPFPAEVSSVHPCSRRRTDGRSRTLRRLSPDARGVGYRRSRPPPPVSPCCRSGTSSTGAVGSTWCPCLLGCSGPVGGGWAPGLLLCAVFCTTRRRATASRQRGTKATRFLQGVLREGPGSPRLKTWRRAGLAAKAGHCGRMYAKRVMTHATERRDELRSGEFGEESGTLDPRIMTPGGNPNPSWVTGKKRRCRRIARPARRKKASMSRHIESGHNVSSAMEFSVVDRWIGGSMDRWIDGSMVAL